MSFESALAETTAGLKRLERWEWYRLSTMFAVSLSLTVGLFVLAYPPVRRDIFTLNNLDTALRGLLALVLLFDCFAVYQQHKIALLRRELAGQIGMLSTLEALRPPTPVEEMQRQNRRRMHRFFLDKRISVSVTSGRTVKTIYGRTRDIAEGGVGAVLSAPVDPGTRARVEIAIEAQSAPLMLDALIVYRRGFSHGFEFVAPSPEDLALIRRICTDLPTVP